MTISLESKFGSADIARVATRLATTTTREEEMEYRSELQSMNIHAAAVDFGGPVDKIISEVMSHAAVAAQRCNLVKETHVELGNVIGACHEVLLEFMHKAAGLNVGGKIALVRYQEHLCVALFAEIGLLSFNEVGLYLAHRAVPNE